MRRQAKTAVGLVLAVILGAGMALTAGCASMGSSKDEDVVEPVPLAPEDREDAECASQIEAVRVKLCVDVPPTLPFDHLDRGLDYLHKFQDTCPEQMRSTYALRKLEKCIDQIEKIPAMQNDDRDERRKQGQKKAAEIKDTDEFIAESKRMARALKTIEDAAIAYDEAVAAGEVNESKFQGAAWDEAEFQYRKARKRIEAMMNHVGLNLDDARALGLL